MRKTTATELRRSEPAHVGAIESGWTGWRPPWWAMAPVPIGFVLGAVIKHSIWWGFGGAFAGTLVAVGIIEAHKKMETETA